MPDARTIVDTLQGLDPLSELHRTGYVMRGVCEAETIAAHSFGVAVAAMLMVDCLREEGEVVDGERVLRMALLHDAPEALTGDVPMPFKTEAHDEAEQRAAEALLPDAWLKLWAEAEAGETLEARIVRAADKVQMMAKVLTYEQQRRGDLGDFWANPKNFRDGGLPIARAVYEEIYRRAGRPIPG